MLTANDLKSADFIDQIIRFAGDLLGIKFKRAGHQRYNAHCPFHVDRKSSFRVRVDGKGVVRFHCFGACDMDCDIYDLIIICRRCSFIEAQQALAGYLGISDFEPARGKRPLEIDPERIEEESPAVIRADPKNLSPEVMRVMRSAAVFYHELLVKGQEAYGKVFEYLGRRGVDDGLIRDFQIGYAPPFKDDEHKGRAFLKAMLAEAKDTLQAHRVCCDAGLIRLLNDGSHFVRFVDFSIEDPYQRAYADFFAGRITFPIFGEDGAVKGIIGRKTDKRGTVWLKQKSEKGLLDTRSWLYGIHKAKPHIQHYKTVIVVEGIFDYFAFYRIFQDTTKPIVVSTLGTHITDETMALFRAAGCRALHHRLRLGRRRHECHSQSRRKMRRRRLLPRRDEGWRRPGRQAQRVGGGHQRLLAEPVVVVGKAGPTPNRKADLRLSHRLSESPQREVVMKPASTPANSDLLPVPEDLINPLKECVYDVDDFLPLLTYDHPNQAALKATLKSLVLLLETRPRRARTERVFKVPVNFLNDEAYDQLGPALILWLRLVIEQQAKKRKIKQIDSAIAEWLNTSRQTIVGYKRMLFRLGYLKLDRLQKVQKLSVNFFPKDPLSQLKVLM